MGNDDVGVGDVLDVVLVPGRVGPRGVGGEGEQEEGEHGHRALPAGQVTCRCRTG